MSINTSTTQFEALPPRPNSRPANPAVQAGRPPLAPVALDFDALIQARNSVYKSQATFQCTNSESNRLLCIHTTNVDKVTT